MADQPVDVRIEDGVAVLTIDNPPVNALSAAVRAALLRGLETAFADPSVRAVVLVAAGRTWPAGADIREFGKPPAAPWLPEICDRIAAAPKPVIAALHGHALGGGLELALAAQVRLADQAARLGLPEVTLGLLPGAGGTQRLPRLIGAGAALRMMLGGQPVTAESAEKMGLVDAVVPGRVDVAALRLARSHATGETALPTAADRALHRDGRAWMAAVAQARRDLGERGLPAPARIVDCVEAALLLPEAEGFAFERAAFEDLLATPESAGLRHAFLAERAAARQPDLQGIAPRPLSRVGIVGGGLMGAGIAMALLRAGFDVTLVEESTEALTAALARISASHDRAVARGQLSAEAREREWDRLSGTTQLIELEDADLVIEAVFEDEAVKRLVFADLGRVTRPGAILATNTSYLDVARIGEASGRPEDVIGLHFFSPAHVMRLVEVIPTDRTRPEVLATAFALARRMGKIAVRAANSEGFIGNRILTACRTAADFLVEDGASPYQVDRAMVAWGFPLGPYQVLDLAGHEISWARRKRAAARRAPGARHVAIPDRICEAGWLGQKAGRGYYRYPEGSRRGEEDPEVLALIEAERARKGIVARPVGSAEIHRRLLAAMANEGARLLEEGVARRPSDIDVVMITGYGYPRWRGGPMHDADQAGLLSLRNALRDYAREDAAFWTPAPLWDELIKNGRRFADLNAG
ncbi:FAD-dependent oxidoreductase [Albidovulum sp.]